MAVDMKKWPIPYVNKYQAAVKAGDTALVNAMKGGPNSAAYKAYMSLGTTDTKIIKAESKYKAALTAATKAKKLADAAYQEFYNVMYRGQGGAITSSAKITYYRKSQNEGFVTMSTTGEYNGIDSGDYVFIFPIANSPLEGRHLLTSVVGNIARFKIPKQATALPPVPVKNPYPNTLIVKGSAVSQIDQKYKKWIPLRDKSVKAAAALVTAQTAWTKAKKAAANANGSNGKPVVQPPGGGLGSSTSPVKVNLPAVVAEMYFPDVPEFNGTAAIPAKGRINSGLRVDGGDVVLLNSLQRVFAPAVDSTPGILRVPQGNVSQKVKEASELWENSKSSKGMIQQWMVAKIDTAGTASKNYNKVQPNKNRSAFQFIYNPSTIDMAWGGTPNVDPALIMSGKDRIPFMGAGFTSSTVSFQVLVNRMADMKYLSDIDATPISFFQKLYNRSDVSTTDLKDIKNNGTMYDIEYLLNTLVPYKMKSVLRKKWTSDIGYLHSFPIELHLGKGLRYLGIISSFNVQHKIFNEDMVPLMSWVNITVSRIPDVAYEKNQITWNQNAGV
jgi:hypothetical protein